MDISTNTVRTAVKNVFGRYVEYKLVQTFQFLKICNAANLFYAQSVSVDCTS
jgi:hypothetical protein